jgi:hypothetical protein
MVKNKFFVTIFVEGVTDKIIYEVFFRKIKKFKEIKEDSIDDSIKNIVYNTEILPLRNSLILARNSNFILIKFVEGKFNLEKICKNIFKAFKTDFIYLYSRRLERIKYNHYIYFLFDKDKSCDNIPSSCLDKIFPTENIQIFSKEQMHPEVMLLSLSKFIETDEVYKLYLSTIEFLQNKGLNLSNKKKINLLKVFIGERCYRHLLEELIKNNEVKKEFENIISNMFIELSL